MGSETILFIGGHYEIKNPGSGQTVTKYYFAGASRIAMRKYSIPQSMAVEYLLGDHLGSTSITTDSSGNKVSEMRYKAWGEVRYSWTAGASTTPAYKLSSYTFTGQYSYMDDLSTSGVTEGFGLMFYNARMYDPALGRFAQADTIVPGGVQGYDRYAYVNNSPINYIDPSGHCAVKDGKIVKTDCTVDDFHKLTWAKRLEWLKLFVQEHKLGDWFDDIEGAIEILSNDPDYQDMDGWAAYIDAGILQAINDGMRMYEKQDPVGGGGGAWASFFSAYNKGWEETNLDGLIVLRLAGEQGGVDYSASLPETIRRHEESGNRVQVKADLFLMGANY